MTTYYVYAKINGSRSIPKGTYTAWVGTTPVGFAKKGDLTNDKKVGYYSKCIWKAEVKRDFDKMSIEFIIKHHKLLGGESEAGRIQLPLKWFPANQVVNDWFPIASRTFSGVDGEEMLLNITVHLAEARVTPFSQPAGSLLVAPAWNRPGRPAVPPTHLAPPSAGPQPAAFPNQFQGYPPQQMQPPQPYPQMQPSYPQYSSQPLYPQSQPQAYYPPQQQIPVMPDASQPVFQPPMVYPTLQPTSTSPESAGMNPYQQPSDQMQSPIYMPPPPENDPSNPYLALNPSEISPGLNNQQQGYQQQPGTPAYPNVPKL